jgi:hypothetical protein
MPTMAPYAMSQHAKWKLSSPPDTQVRVDEDVLTMRAPLVRVHRADSGEWSFDGPGVAPRPAKTASLGAVAHAWPHVCALSQLDSGAAAVWSWRQHGWAGEFECRCGNCDRPVAADLDRRNWPSDLRPDQIVSVELIALSGRVELADILTTPGGIALLGPGDHRRTSDTMTPVAVVNVIRRWPHTMQALRALGEGRGMRWSPDTLHWHEYVLA